MSSAGHSSYRAEIDGLRAFAVLSILIFHANNAWLPGGFVGVDIFFVISGYLITQILLADIAAGRYSIRRFYARRVRRIFPALLVVLTGCIALGWWLLVPKEYETLGKHIAAASVFISNVQLWKEAGYFDSTAELKPLLHLWSLGVEEQFYILWPLLLYAGHRFRLKLGPWMGVLAMLSLALSFMRSETYAISSFYLPHTRFWELMAGGLLAIYAAPLARFTGRLPANLLPLFGLCLLIAACVFFSKLEPYPGWRAALPVLGAALIIATSGSFVHRAWLSNRWMVGIGLISYPLYLWHWPLLAFARILYWDAPPIPIILGLIALAFVLATLTYHFIESPIRFGRWKQHRVWPLLVLMLAVGGSGIAIESSDGFKKFRTTDSKFQDLVGAHTFTETVPACPEKMNAAGNWCSIARDGEPTAALYGDSHADALFPGLATRDAHRNWMLLGYSSCPPLAGIASYKRGDTDACVKHLDRALQLLVEQKQIRTVVLASLGSSTSTEAFHRNTRARWPVVTGCWKARMPMKLTLTNGAFCPWLESTVSTLEAAGKQVVLFIDVPELDFWAVSCLPRIGKYSYDLGTVKIPCSVSRSEALSRQAVYRDILHGVAARHTNVRLFDSFDALCDDTKCYAATPHMLRYSDSHHLSIRGSVAMADQFLGWLNTQAIKSGNASATAP